MVSRNKTDIHAYATQVKTVINRIETDSKLSENNRKKILEYKDTLFSEGLSNARILKLLDQLQRLTLWLNKDLEQVTEKDLRALVTKVEQNEAYSSWTKQGYKVSVKRFWRWLAGSEEYPKIVRWIKTSTKHSQVKLPSQMWSEEEIQTLIEKGCLNARSKAIVATLYEGGLRIGELGSLRIQDVEFLNGEAYLTVMGKSGSRRIFVKFAVPYLRQWINQFHPNPKPESNLFVKTVKPIGEPLGYNSYRNILVKAAKRSGVNKPYNSHQFRHSRATFLSGYLTDSQLMGIFGWRTRDMCSIYSHLSGKNVTTAVKRIYGLGEEEQKKESMLKTITCPICGEVNPVGSVECSKCFNPLSLKKALEGRHQLKDVQERMLKLEQDIQAVLKK